MNFIYLLILFIVILFICEIISILLKITGLDMEKARFQTISIITHTGFTTRESELIAQHPVRRKIIGYFMIISYVGQATFFSLLITTMKDKGFFNIIILVGSLLLIILLIIKNQRFLLKFEPLLDKYIASRWFKYKSNKRINEILYITEDFQIIELVLTSNSRLCNIYLHELKKDLVTILKIDKGIDIIPFPKGNDYIEEGDKLVLYGKVDVLTELENENR